MKKIFFLPILLFVTSVNAQVFVQSAATLSLNGNSLLTIDGGNVTNKGTIIPGTSTVLFKGSTAQTLGGSGISNFNIINQTNTNGLTIASDIAVADKLTMNGPILVNNKTVTFATTAIIENETETNRLYDVTNTNISNVTISKNFSSAITNENLGNLGVEIVTSPALGNTTIKRYVLPVVHYGSSTGLIRRYYDVNPTNNTALNATARFYYLDAELSGVDETTAVLWKSTNNGASWQQIVPTNRSSALNYLELSGINDFSLWTIGSPSSILPIYLTSLNTNCVNTGVQINWALQMSSDVKNILLEKSKEGSSWKTVTTITGNNDKFTDGEKGVFLYRIKAIHQNGSVTYSQIVKSSCEVATVALFLYPNPTNGYANIVIPSTKKQNTELKIFSSDGKLISAKTYNLQSGSNTILINTYAYASGNYIAVCSIDGENKTVKFVKK